MEEDKPLIWLHGEVKTPPMSQEARIETGFLLRKLQQGDNLEMLHSRSMQSISKYCHELRIPDGDKNWRIIYRIDEDGIIIVEVFNKTTRATLKKVIETCKKRLTKYDCDTEE